MHQMSDNDSYSGGGMNSEEFDREFNLEQSIRIIASENAELLERLKDE
jgi:hypothetical protein